MSRYWYAMVVVLLMVAAAGCGNAAEEVLEQAIENQIEDEGGSGDVDIDLDEDEGVVSIETEEGSFQIGGGEIPDDFLLPIPNYIDVEMVSSQTGDFAGATVALTFDGDDFEDVISLYEDFFTDEGWEFSRTDTTTGNETMVLIFAESDELGASVIVNYSEGDETGNLNVQYADN